MKKTIVICDKCKKEIKGKYFNLVAGKCGSKETMNVDHEYCEECICKIIDFANGAVEYTPEPKAEEKPKEKPEVKKETIIPEKKKEVKKNPERNAETNKVIIPVTKRMNKTEKIKHLYNQGCSNRYIAATVGTTENTVSVTICQLRKKGEIK